LDLNINLSSSYFIGDKITDIEAGYRAGCNTILVLTGMGLKTHRSIRNGHSTIEPNTIQATLFDALAWILNQENL
jgi:histidinol phosphatase-like enzyme